MFNIELIFSISSLYILIILYRSYCPKFGGYISEGILVGDIWSDYFDT